MQQNSINYGTKRIEYALLKANRKRLMVEVHPDLSVKVIAPIGTSLESIEIAVKKKAKWISQQQNYFSAFLPRDTTREFKNGESHKYLGRRYILVIKKAKQGEVKLKNGQLQLSTANPLNKQEVKNQLSSWYYKHAKKKFSTLLNNAMSDFPEIKSLEPSLTIREMKKKWGSCTKKGSIILNPQLVQAPVGCVNYVIYHELCHLIEFSHRKEFYALLDLKCPNWKYWKEYLEKYMA